MRVAIQTTNSGQFHNINFFNAYMGFKKLGYGIEYFTWDDSNAPWNLSKNDLFVPSKDQVVVAGIPVIDWVYDKLGINIQPLDYYPKELFQYLDRSHRKVKIGDIRTAIQSDLEKGEINQHFIKPLITDRKKFTGHVVSRFVDLIRTSGLDNDKLVWCSDVVNFLSEYRIFVLNKTIVDMKHYNGDFMIYPNPGTIQQMVKDYTEAPASYVIDVGVVKSDHLWLGQEKTVLVEVNDGNSFGCYGLSPIIYANMIASRWQEVMHTYDQQSE